MVGDLLLVLLGVALGAGATVLVHRPRRGTVERTEATTGVEPAMSAEPVDAAPEPVPESEPEPVPVPVPVEPAAAPRPFSARLRETIEALGAELRAAAFDSTGPEATPQTLKEYALAQEAYERAASASSPAAAAAAVRTGRAALIRLDARLSGRPVPIDALPDPADGEQEEPAEPEDLEADAGEPFLTTGGGADRTTEVLIHRPEPGRPALLDLVATGDGNLFVNTVSHTENQLTDLDSLVNVTETYRGHHFLPPEATHVRIETVSSENRRWSARVLPLSAASPLTPEHRGNGDDVLAYEGGPAQLTVQITSKTGWTVRFMCGCLAGRICECREPRWPDALLHESTRTHGLYNGRQTIRLPRPGYLIVHEDGGGGSWYLTTEPVDESPQPAPRPRPRPRPRPKKRKP